MEKEIEQLKEQLETLQNDFQEALNIIRDAYFLVRGTRYYLIQAELEAEENNINEKLMTVKMYLPESERNRIHSLNDDIINFFTRIEERIL